MLTNKIFNASALEVKLQSIFAYYQMYLCLLTNLFLLTIKCQYDCYQM